MRSGGSNPPGGSEQRCPGKSSSPSPVASRVDGGARPRCTRVDGGRPTSLQFPAARILRLPSQAVNPTAKPGVFHPCRGTNAAPTRPRRVRTQGVRPGRGRRSDGVPWAACTWASVPPGCLFRASLRVALSPLAALGTRRAAAAQESSGGRAPSLETGGSSKGGIRGLRETDGAWLSLERADPIAAPWAPRGASRASPASGVAARILTTGRPAAGSRQPGA